MSVALARPEPLTVDDNDAAAVESAETDVPAVGECSGVSVGAALALTVALAAPLADIVPDVDVETVGARVPETDAQSEKDELASAVSDALSVEVADADEAAVAVGDASPVLEIEDVMQGEPLVSAVALTGGDRVDDAETSEVADASTVMESAGVHVALEVMEFR